MLFFRLNPSPAPYMRLLAVRKNVWILLLGLIAAFPAGAAERYITVASTTSTENSGLFRYLLPQFSAETGIEVRVVAVGTGQAIKLAERGDADVLFVHHKPSELKFVEAGYGVKRYDVMYNDFVIVGPKADPAGISGGKDSAEAFGKIARTRALFASRGDNSGTYKKELSLWQAAGVNMPADAGTWYRETGAGMGATLNTASGMEAYTLTDRATWLNFNNKGNLVIVVEGDPGLFNQYGIILVNAKKQPHVKTADGQAFIDWVVSPTGQAAIDAFRIKENQAFFANARKEQ